ncbi:DUF3047 domain-containing protein [Saccharospirillum salsuginis]|uniref:DUF3047 domain-containing protein n=1 Tax=Saccharospirillum salsuginis TaxID=418750 RepID=A0A918KHB8_9GAMM|nr:DUF3047 domain-containing protein [Saccharospirillum salsuginis]GGX60907.1 hypothetical protein GCM10007392_31160 [Saccharospirillum salsuginis]
MKLLTRQRVYIENERHCVTTQRMATRTCINTTLLLILAGLGSTNANTLPLDRIDNWRTHRFVGESTFSWRPEEQTLCMESNGTASARIWEADEPWRLTDTLSWQWQPTRVISEVDQRSREGDDFPGRVYVAVQHPIFFWRSRVLAYVHASDMAVNEHWPNPFTDQFHMWVVSTGDDMSWRSIERSIADDWETAFGDRPERFHAIGLMADSDNSGQSTRLCLRDLSVADTQ